MKRKNAETIAYLHDQDRQALQKFIGQTLWDDGLLIEEFSADISYDSALSEGWTIRCTAAAIVNVRAELEWQRS